MGYHLLRMEPFFPSWEPFFAMIPSLSTALIFGSLKQGTDHTIRSHNIQILIVQKDPPFV